MRTLAFRAMNTEILLALEGDESDSAGLQAAQLLIQDCERRFSRFLPESELSQLNRLAGAWQPVSADLMEILLLAADYHRATAGLFDPAILPDLKRAGYDQSMALIRGRDLAAPLTVASSPARRTFAEVEFDQPAGRVRLPRGMEIDLGGIAKAWIIDQAADLLNAYSLCCAVSAGGDIRFIGYPAGILDWRVEVEDPRDPVRTAALLSLGPAAVATSSLAKRAWSQAGQPRHHLIDPRSGEPARSKWLSATVIAENILDAEIYAKVLLIGGEEQAAQLPDGLTYLTVDVDGALGGSQLLGNKKQGVIS